MEAVDRRGGDADSPFEGVVAVAELLDTGGETRRSAAFRIPPTSGATVFTLSLLAVQTCQASTREASAAVVISVPTSSVVSRAASRSAIGKQGEARGQVVAERFYLGGEVGVVEDEAGVVLHHAQAFGGAVGGGVLGCGGGWAWGYEFLRNHRLKMNVKRQQEQEEKDKPVYDNVSTSTCRLRFRPVAARANS